MLTVIWVVAGFISAILFFIDDLKRGENLIVSNFIFYLFLIFGGLLSLILTIMSFFSSNCINDILDINIWKRNKDGE